MMDSKAGYTGRNRRHGTKLIVRVADIAARSIITVAGIGTILAVSLVCLFLFWVAVPLFFPASVESPHSLPLDWSGRKPLHLAVDEYRVIGWVLFPDGCLQLFRLDNGEVIEKRQLFEEPLMTCGSFAIADDRVAFGFTDGTVRLGQLGFQTSFLETENVPADLKELAAGAAAEMRGGVVTRTPEGQFRLQQLHVELSDPIATGSQAPVLLVDHVTRSSNTTFCALTKDGKLRLSTVNKRRNLLTGKVTYRTRNADLPYDASGHQGRRPSYLLLSGLADNVYLAWDDGHCVRYSTQKLSDPRIMEELDLVPDPRQSLTVLRFLLGRGTLLAGDSGGKVTAWFRVESGERVTGDGSKLAAAHEFAVHDAAVSALTSSSRSRLLAIGYADGQARLVQVTSEAVVAQIQAASGAALDLVVIPPKEDGLLAATKSGVYHWQLDPKYPETTLASLFLPVWYEGYPEPQHVWQSSSATDSFEPKLGLFPLVFGTLKATFYSMVFAIPLALLAAVYTSEFLHPGWKSIVKPAVELMASLPSVVLGFLAALVFAPFIERYVPAAMLSLMTVPICILAGGYLWQTLPRDLSLRFGRWRLLLVLAMIAGGMWLAIGLGSVLERVLFAGDLVMWLDGQVGRAAGGWWLFLFPLTALTLAYASSQIVSPRLRRIGADWSSQKAAAVEIARFVVLLTLSIAVAGVLAYLLDYLQLDLRGSVAGTYVQRNALVVGFVMGFAVIPIIYTIAEDALSTVPEHLRAASFGAGATPWQTAVRIIIPTAMSGLFSAVMIGLGRAVGETMIVLMAAGNTPVLDLNIFNGFRTLSANIAVEMPEAVRNSAHYRTLFLAALTLFLMTFAINTVAEVVRLRFRKRAFEL